MRAWVPGRGKGEDVYSLSMMFTQYLDEHRPEQFDRQIFETDITEAAHCDCPRGIYTLDALFLAWWDRQVRASGAAAKMRFRAA